MSERSFKVVLVAAMAFFVAAFVFVVVPPLWQHPDIVGAFAAGFVNPFAAGYSTDVITCWVILAAWVAFEARAYGVRHGWVCLVLGIIPGVAVGLAMYLLVRRRQIREGAASAQRLSAVDGLRL